MRKNSQKPNISPYHKDTLVIIGNGFDIWQGLHTDYSEFQSYYLKHRDEILKKLRIKKRVIQYEDGETICVSDVELIYGNPFDPGELDETFWHTFEASLDNLDAQQLNLYFGKDRRGLREMKRSIRDANRILREAFCRWIATISIEPIEQDFRFGDNCIFINFNYTDTLSKRFHVKESDEFHIHGEAADKKSIIFGHTSHPQEPEYALYKFGGRFRGLYFVDKILYETDKHAEENIKMLCMFLAMCHGMMPEEIKQVYVLGHSMGLSDIEYFDFLVNATSVHRTESAQNESEFSEIADPVDELHNRLQYVINHVGYKNDGDITKEQEDAMLRKLESEQDAVNAEVQRSLRKIIRKRIDEKEVEQPRIVNSTENAEWHISYYSERDRLWIEALMKELGCTNFKLYPSIEQCLAQMNT